jgi:hypothetical protein
MFGVRIVDPKADPNCERCKGEGVVYGFRDGYEGFFDCTCRKDK